MITCVGVGIFLICIALGFVTMWRLFRCCYSVVVARLVMDSLVKVCGYMIPDIQEIRIKSLV